MDGVITMDDARALVGDAKLWPLVRGFLWDFAPQVNGTWLEGLEWHETSDARREEMSDASHVSRLMSNSRVKRYILDSLGVEPCFHTFPKEDGSRLLLLDGATLESAAKWLGALASVESLRRVTSGEVVRGLRTKLRGIYPEVFSYTAYFKDLDSRGGAEARSEDIVAEVVANGYGLLFSAFSKLPASVMSRAKFKLPKDLRFSASPREIDLPVVLKLFKLKFPEAYKLCCS